MRLGHVSRDPIDFWISLQHAIHEAMEEPSLFTDVPALEMLGLAMDHPARNSAIGFSAGHFVFVGIALTAAVCAVGRDYLYARLSAAVLADLRRTMYQHLQRLSISYFSRTRTGDILSCFSTDLAAVENVLVVSLPLAVSSLAWGSGWSAPFASRSHRDHGS